MQPSIQLLTQKYRTLGPTHPEVTKLWDAVKITGLHMGITSLEQFIAATEIKSPENEKADSLFDKYNADPNNATATEAQYFQLQSQIESYQKILKGHKIPMNTLSGSKTLTAEEWLKLRKQLQIATNTFYKTKFEEGDVNINDLMNFMQRLLKSDKEKYEKIYRHSTHISQLESRIVDNRLKEIEKILEKDDLTEDVKSELLIHLKMLNLRDIQLELRADIVGTAKDRKEDESILEKYLVDRFYYTRAKYASMHSKKESKTAEKFERQMRCGQEKRKKARQRDFVDQVLNQYRDFMDFHKKKKVIVKKTCGLVKAYWEQAEKKEQRFKDKEEQDRLKKLKQNDMEGYLKMLKEAKNERLLEIVNQTQRYLEQLGAKVKVQKRENIAYIKAKNEESLQKEADQCKLIEEVGESDEITQRMIESSKSYFSLTHTIQEEILYDPKLLTGGKLKNYQIAGVKWLVSLYNNNLNGILADEMGLGKTIQTLALFCYLIEKKGNDGPYLVVVPLSTLSNWVMEIEKWAPTLKKLVYKGNPMNRRLLAHVMKTEKFNIILTTYEYIMKDKHILNRIVWQYIVVDEGHRMKNYKSKFALTLGQHYQSAHRVLLTGTPLQNNLTELWALLNFLLPKIFSSCEDFEKWFNKAFARIGSERGSDKNLVLNEEEKLLIIHRLHQILRPFLLRREKKEVEKELPNKIEYIVKVELSAWQRIIYNQIKEYGMLAIDPSTGIIGRKALMNTMMQLRKICNHPYLFMNIIDSEFLLKSIVSSSGKFELLDRMLPKLINTGHKILIFSQMTQLMDIMEIFFDLKGFKHLRLDGTTKADDRGESMALFNKIEDIKIFLLSTRAGGQGLNLQAADTVIIFDSDFNPQMDLQAQDRAHRIGQKHEVKIFRLITTTKIEEDILSRAAKKKNIDDAVITAGMFNQKASLVESKERLKKILENDDNISDDEEDEIPNDEQINQWVARSDAEFEDFQEIDRKRYILEKKDEVIQKVLQKLKLETLPKNFNYRLMQDYDVPEWVKMKNPEEDKESEDTLGKRKRKAVVYTDDLTETQWLKIVDEGKDLGEESEKIRQRKLLKKKKKDSESSPDDEYKAGKEPKPLKTSDEESNNDKVITSPKDMKHKEVSNKKISKRIMNLKDQAKLEIEEEEELYPELKEGSDNENKDKEYSGDADDIKSDEEMYEIKND